MEVQLSSTTKIVHLNGVPARVWVGVTKSGISVHAFITRIAIDKNEKQIEEFERDLQEHKVPTAEIEAIPLRMVL